MQKTQKNTMRQFKGLHMLHFIAPTFNTVEDIYTAIMDEQHCEIFVPLDVEDNFTLDTEALMQTPHFGKVYVANVLEATVLILKYGGHSITEDGF